MGSFSTKFKSVGCRSFAGKGAHKPLTALYPIWDPLAETGEPDLELVLDPPKYFLPALNSRPPIERFEATNWIRVQASAGELGTRGEATHLLVPDADGALHPRHNALHDHLAEKNAERFEVFVGELLAFLDRRARS